MKTPHDRYSQEQTVRSIRWQDFQKQNVNAYILNAKENEITKKQGGGGYITDRGLQGESRPSEMTTRTMKLRVGRCGKGRLGCGSMLQLD